MPSPCTLNPTIPTPSLPSGISLPSYSLPAPPLPALVCCQLQLPTFPTPALPLPTGALEAASTAFNTFLSQFQAFFDLMPIPCPTE